MENNKWKHIVDGKIEWTFETQPIRLQSRSLKDIISEDLNQVFDQTTKLLVYKNKMTKYHIYLTNAGTGGKISEKNSRKKVPIINSQFLIDRILKHKPGVIFNIYVPLKKHNKSFLPMLEERVYLIIKPETIYSYYWSKKMFDEYSINKRISASNRWVRLEEIAKVIKDKSISANRRQNVHIVHNSRIKEFLDKSIFLESYNSVKKFGYDKRFAITEENIDDLWKKPKKYELKEYKKEDFIDSVELRVLRKSSLQSIFRHNLLLLYAKCAFCNIDICSILDGAHINDIKNINNITPEAYSEYNGILACKNHHKLFDDKEIIIEENGSISGNQDIKNKLNTNKHLHPEYIKNLDKMKKFIKLKYEPKDLNKHL